MIHAGNAITVQMFLRTELQNSALTYKVSRLINLTVQPLKTSGGDCCS